MRVLQKHSPFYQKTREKHLQTHLLIIMASMATNNEQNAAPTDAPQGGADSAPGSGDAPAGEEVESNWTEVTATFDDMDLKEDLLRGIYAYGFEKPSAIQQRGIVPVLQGRDTIAQAQSGTGKTATFSVAILQSVDMDVTGCQALVLAPTRN